MLYVNTSLSYLNNLIHKDDKAGMTQTNWLSCCQSLVIFVSNLELMKIKITHTWVLSNVFQVAVKSHDKIALHETSSLT